MSFVPKTWVGRSVQYPGRIRLIPTGENGVFDVQRAEGEIVADGDLVSDVALNDLEQRILTAILSKADGTGGAANNALALGGVEAEAYPNINHIDDAVLTLINGWSAIWGGITARRFGRVLEINLYGAFTGPSNTIIAMLPTGYNPSQSVHAIQIPTGFLVVEGNTIKAQATSIEANSFSVIV